MPDCLLHLDLQVRRLLDMQLESLLGQEGAQSCPTVQVSFTVWSPNQNPQLVSFQEYLASGRRESNSLQPGGCTDKQLKQAQQKFQVIERTFQGNFEVFDTGMFTQ